mmetsp:Transcript_26484/g.66645  ORF Transcript_26484/g.66645 Transcript_26484/m.66645 type:complete len:244 (+) Transcript_26484:767-1498(+)
MISFDYASKYKVPTTAAQTQAEFMGEEFGLDVFLFGITNEGSRTYFNYYYPEGYSSGDPNTVISMVHHHMAGEPRAGQLREAHRVHGQLQRPESQQIPVLLPHQAGACRLPQRGLVELHGGRTHPVLPRPRFWADAQTRGAARRVHRSGPGEHQQRAHAEEQLQVRWARGGSGRIPRLQAVHHRQPQACGWDQEQGYCGDHHPCRNCGRSPDLQVVQAVHPFRRAPGDAGDQACTHCRGAGSW